MSTPANISADFLSGLARAAGAAHVFVGDKIKPDMAHDEKSLYGTAMPAAVAEAADTDQVSAILTLCSAEAVPVTVRGAGTGLCGGSVPTSGGIVLDMSKMNKILAFNEGDMTLTVQPGVLLQDITAAADGRGLYYPPDPGEKTASIGGNLSTNAGGPCALKYGTTRDYVLALTAVLPTGEILRLGGSVLKSSCGADLLRLIVGSEGTLAVITELTLRLIPKKAFNISFILPYASAGEAFSAADVLRRSGLEPACIEFLPRDTLVFSAAFTGEHVFPEEDEACLLVTLESTTDSGLDTLMEQFAEIAEETGPSDILVIDTPTLKKNVWAAHAAIQTAVEMAAKRFDESDSVVPISKAADYYQAVRDIAGEEQLSLLLYGHAGDGCFHVFVFNNDLSQDAFAARADAFMRRAYGECARLGGVISGEHGIGSGKRGFLAAVTDEAQTKLLRRVKAAFDPQGILNPGKAI